MSEISDALSISGSAVSRNVAAFSHNKGRGEPGHRLLVSTEDPLDRRRRIVTNTPASRKLAQEVVDILRSAFDRAAAPMPPRSMGDSRGANPGAI
jgi:DNA-binding MarR family transcriptional regulator